MPVPVPGCWPGSDPLAGSPPSSDRCGDRVPIRARRACDLGRRIGGRAAPVSRPRPRRMRQDPHVGRPSRGSQSLSRCPCLPDHTATRSRDDLRRVACSILVQGALSRCLRKLSLDPSQETASVGDNRSLDSPTPPSQTRVESLNACSLLRRAGLAADPGPIYRALRR